MKTPEGYIRQSMQIYDTPFYDDPMIADKIDDYLRLLGGRLTKCLNDFNNEYPNCVNIRFEISLEYPQYPEDGDNASIWFDIVADRPMNKKELERAAQEKADRETRQAEYERVQYEALKKKFEGKKK